MQIVGLGNFMKEVKKMIKSLMNCSKYYIEIQKYLNINCFSCNIFYQVNRIVMNYI